MNDKSLSTLNQTAVLEGLQDKNKYHPIPGPMSLCHAILSLPPTSGEIYFPFF